jgi:hypothetical protein
MSGKLYHNPSDIIAQLLDDYGLANLPDSLGSIETGWTVYPLHMPEAPDQVLAVMDTSGRLHRRMHVTGVTGEHYGIQILARSSEDVAAPYRKIKSLLEYFDENVIRTEVTLTNSAGTMNHTYRVNSITRVSMALPAGVDGRRYLYSGNVLASIEWVSSEAIETGTGS